MHSLQKYILDKLRLKQPLSYSDMLPQDVVSSQFQYHLKVLQAEGLIQKESRGRYSLTHAGQAAVEYMSLGRDTLVRMPKVITYTLLTHHGQLLLVRKLKEPYRNLVEPVAGKIHFGEDATDAAQREVLEKCGLTIPRPKFCGTANILITKDGKPLTHMTAYVHKAELADLPDSLPSNIVVAPVDALGPPAHFVPGSYTLVQVFLKQQETPLVLDIRAEI